MLENDGLYWNNSDLHTLRSLASDGLSCDIIAIRLGRTESAVRARLRIIRTALLFLHGNDNDTLKNFDIRGRKNG